MSLSVEDHLDNLIRHIRLVQDACILLGTKLIKNGEETFGRNLIARGFSHDSSKFFGIEWKYLHAGEDVPEDKLLEAIQQHQETSDHHIPYWNTIDKMPDICLAELTCDVYARSQEFGTDVREFIKNTLVEKYEISRKDVRRINKYVNLLLENSFVKLDK